MRRAHKPSQARQRAFRDEVWHPSTEPPQLNGWYWTERMQGAEKTPGWYDAIAGEWLDVLRRPLKVTSWSSDVAEEDGEPFAYRARKIEVCRKSYRTIAEQLGIKMSTFRWWVLYKGCPFEVEGAQKWIRTNRTQRK